METEDWGSCSCVGGQGSPLQSNVPYPSIASTISMPCCLEHQTLFLGALLPFQMVSGALDTEGLRSIPLSFVSDCHKKLNRLGTLTSVSCCLSVLRLQI